MSEKIERRDGAEIPVGNKEVLGPGSLDLEELSRKFLAEQYRVNPDYMEPVKPTGGLVGKNGETIGCDYAYHLWGKDHQGRKKLIGVMAGHFSDGEWVDTLKDASFIPADELDLEKL